MIYHITTLAATTEWKVSSLDNIGERQALSKGILCRNFLWHRKKMTNTISRLKVACFCHNMQPDDTQCYRSGILDFAWHLATRMKFGTCQQNWDLYGTVSGLWSQSGPSPKFGTSLRALFLLFGFFLFRDQIFRNQDFFPRPNFFETKTKLFFRDLIFWNQTITLKKFNLWSWPNLVLKVWTKV